MQNRESVGKREGGVAGNQRANLPDVRQTHRVIAILCSDLHLSHNSPAARSVETDWYEVMRRQILQLENLYIKYDCPVICAGDIFDRWNAPAELINFAMAYLPPMYAIPGQHDLPNHRYDLITKSAYWTLVQAGKITNLHPEDVEFVDQLVLYSFPWGFEVTPLNRKAEDRTVKLAVVHSYIWKDKETSYVGAPEEKKLSKYAKALQGYDAAVFGDNHKGFLTRINSGQVLNCGTFMRRKLDEIDYKPQVGLLYEDGTIQPHYLNVDNEQFSSDAVIEKRIAANSGSLDDLVERLKDSCYATVTLCDALKMRLEKEPVSKDVEEIIYDALESHDNERGRS